MSSFFDILTQGQINYTKDINLLDLNNNLLKINLKAVKTYDKSLLVLKNLNDDISITTETHELIEKFNEYYFDKIEISNEKIKKLINLKVINDEKEYTEIFLVQNKEYLLEAYGDFFFECEHCKFLLPNKKKHPYCQNKFEEFLNK